MRFSSYGLFVAAMGYSPAEDAVIDTGGTSVWRVSRNGNPCRFSADGGVRVTICETKNARPAGFHLALGLVLGCFDSTR